MKWEVHQLARRHVKFTTAAGLLLVASLVLYRYLYLILLAWCFVVGIGGFYYLLRPPEPLPNILFFLQRKKIKSEEVNITHKVCPVCGSETCSRHRPEINIVQHQPWLDLKIPQKVDSAIEKFLNKVLESFVYTWHRNLSENEAFVDELRSSLRFIVAVLLRRLRKVDLPTVITDKLIRAGLQHLHFSLDAKHKCKVLESKDLQKAVLEYYGAFLHCANTTRTTELEYVRKVVECLFPHILPQTALQSRSLCSLLREILAGSILLPAMDKVSDPDIINCLILIFVDETPPPENPDPLSPKVCVLEEFSKSRGNSQSALHPVITDIAHNQDLLYPFMNFLKKQGAVHVLQCYLSLEDFNRQLLKPDLSDKEMEKLHLELQKIYSNHWAENSFDKIQLESDVIKELQLVVEGSAGDVAHLQKSDAFFRAHEHVHNLLEKTFLPLFLQSDDYYAYICGERLSRGIQRSISRLSKREKNSKFSKLGNKIKGVLKSDTVDGKYDDPDCEMGGDELDMGMDAISIGEEDQIPYDAPDSYIDYHQEINEPAKFDLSTWRVTIPSVEMKNDQENQKKTNIVFNIEVYRIDTLDGAPGNENNWTISRKYGEFYALESKLKEFHGGLLADTQLPSKKFIGSKGLDYMNSKRLIFEEYLQKLCRTPVLKTSELVRSFFEKENSFPRHHSDVNLGRALKSIPNKLVKQKGQHLDHFLQSFYTSTEAPKPVPCDPTDDDGQSASNDRLSCSIYENNANRNEELTEGIEDMVDTVDNSPQIEGIFDTLVYVVQYVYHAPTWLHHLLITVRKLTKNTVEHLVDWFIGQKIEGVSQEHRVKDLIELLEFNIFDDDAPERTAEDKDERKREALSQFKDFIPNIIKSVIGHSNFESGTNDMFEILQQPVLNKQLTYVFLDIVVKELFPEVTEQLENIAAVS